jgi:hypothetical protein
MQMHLLTEKPVFTKTDAMERLCTYHASGAAVKLSGFKFHRFGDGGCLVAASCFIRRGGGWIPNDFRAESFDSEGFARSIGNAGMHAKTAEEWIAEVVQNLGAVFE